MQSSSSLQHTHANFLRTCRHLLMFRVAERQLLCSKQAFTLKFLCQDQELLGLLHFLVAAELAFSLGVIVHCAHTCATCYWLNRCSQEHWGDKRTTCATMDKNTHDVKASLLPPRSMSLRSPSNSWSWHKNFKVKACLLRWQMGQKAAISEQ